MDTRPGPCVKRTAPTPSQLSLPDTDAAATEAKERGSEDREADFRTAVRGRRVAEGLPALPRLTSRDPSHAKFTAAERSTAGVGLPRNEERSGRDAGDGPHIHRRFT